MTAQQQLTDANSLDQDLWHRFIRAEHSFHAVRVQLMRSPSIVALVRAGLKQPKERPAALNVAALLPIDARQQLFADLLALVSFGHGRIGVVREIILSLPRDWLLAHIEEYAEPLLAYEDYEEYRRLLELYSLIDRDLTLRLAHRAAAHGDADIREAGEDFLANPNPFAAKPAAATS